jgi:dsDNA-binding SOS-regulon protein
MLDKDDEEGAAVVGESPKKEADAYIEEDEMLDIAEKCFMRIADAIISKEISVRDAFKKHITKEVAQTAQGEDQEEIELITPMGFLEGVK